MSPQAYLESLANQYAIASRNSPALAFTAAMCDVILVGDGRDSHQSAKAMVQ